eukprot:CAMPEP_0113314864 /NCGR_PEP_ID=MMETSP0010_2-20120614/10752_1 /TAXON_ID=216773 ORGANISM="Corethron hystrix, Strain 308" /NCGR_SAMPLE_ID=MMETSP0010_2 /ASSEMBLY_ACC=CAM_ASM_000155 /LENGTH=322 /DNA_ID=CAMNT_0000171231 /DNA_START=156 /DNA_END=1127 /DNA_ORIENTATION=- /assembly_acc=CAM_ASM_000155
MKRNDSMSKIHASTQEVVARFKVMAPIMLIVVTALTTLAIILCTLPAEIASGPQRELKYDANRNSPGIGPFPATHAFIGYRTYSTLNPRFVNSGKVVDVAAPRVSNSFASLSKKIGNQALPSTREVSNRNKIGTTLSLSEAVGDIEIESIPSDNSGSEANAVEELSSKKIMSRLKRIFKKKDDGEDFKTKLKNMGLNVFLSYGWVSNMGYSISVSLAWFIFSKRTGLSPLAPGQWPKFLAVYAGFFALNNVIRPLRFAISVGVSKYFDTAIIKIQEKTKWSKPVAIGLLVFLVNVCGTFAAMFTGIFLASVFSGVPIWLPKV